MLRNAVGGGGVSFPGKRVTKVYGSTLLALQGGWVGVKYLGMAPYRPGKCISSV